MRTDLYSTIHKAQRFHLFRLAEAMGRTDFTDPVSTERVRSQLSHLIGHLRDHARNEDTYIHPLFSSVGRGLSALEQDHAALEVALEELERIATEVRWGEVYACYTTFLGRYLQHVAAEERLQAEILWPSYTDDQLAAVLTRFMAERSPEASKADLAFMVPALSIPELTKIFQRMKISAPPAAFQGAYQLASNVLDASELAQLDRALSFASAAAAQVRVTGD